MVHVNAYLFLQNSKVQCQSSAWANKNAADQLSTKRHAYGAICRLWYYMHWTLLKDFHVFSEQNICTSMFKMMTAMALKVPNLSYLIPLASSVPTRSQPWLIKKNKNKKFPPIIYIMIYVSFAGIKVHAEAYTTATKPNCQSVRTTIHTCIVQMRVLPSMSVIRVSLCPKYTCLIILTICICMLIYVYQCTIDAPIPLMQIYCPGTYLVISEIYSEHASAVLASYMSEVYFINICIQE